MPMAGVRTLEREVGPDERLPAQRYLDTANVETITVNVQHLNVRAVLALILTALLVPLAIVQSAPPVAAAPVLFDSYAEINDTAGTDVSDDGTSVVHARPITDGSYGAPLAVYDVATESVQVLEDASGYELRTSTSSAPVISGNGTFIAYEPWAWEGEPGDGFSLAGFDRSTGTVENVSVDAVGNNVWNLSYDVPPSVSDDGSIVAFETSNPETGRTHSSASTGYLESGVWVRDRSAGTTTPLRDPFGTGANNFREPSVSGDGTWVAVTSRSDLDGLGETDYDADVFIAEVGAATDPIRVSAVGTTGEATRDGGFANSSDPDVSENGRFVAFATTADNLGGSRVFDVPYESPSEATSTHIIVRDRDSDGAGGFDEPGGVRTDRVDMGSLYSSNPQISDDGLTLSFETRASPYAGTVYLQVWRRASASDSFRPAGLTWYEDGWSSHYHRSHLADDAPSVVFDQLLPAGMFVGAISVDLPSRYARNQFELFFNTPAYPHIADPVSTATGSLTADITDIYGPANTFGLSWRRSYDSARFVRHALGPGWTDAYSMAIAENEGTGTVELLDELGRLITFAPDGSGWSRPPEFEGRLSQTGGTFSVTFMDGSAWHFDSSGQLASMSSWDGQSVALTRAADGRLETITNSPTGHALSFTYDDVGRLTNVSSSWGAGVEYAHDAGLAVRRVDNGSPLTTWTRYETDEGTGLIQAEYADSTDPYTGGRLVASQTFDEFGRVLTQQTPTGAAAPYDVRTTTFSYDDANRTTSVHDSILDETVTYRHDALGRLNEVEDPSANRYMPTFDENGQLVEATTRGGLHVQRTYEDPNDTWLPTEVGDNLRGTSTYTYDDFGRLATSTVPNGGDGATTTYCYGPGTFPSCNATDGNEIPVAVTDDLGNTTTFEVADGLVHSESDPDGVTTEYSYDSQRRQVAVIDGDGNVTRTDYCEDDDGRVVAVFVVNPRGAATSDDTDPCTPPDDYYTATHYRPDGLVASERAPDGGITTYTYDMSGRLDVVTSPSGATMSYTYDPATGRLASKTTPAPAGSGVDAVTTTYSTEFRPDGDDMVEVAVTTGPDGARTEEIYGTLGRVVARRVQVHGAATPETTDDQYRTTTFTHNADGHVETTTNAAGEVTTTRHDAAGRVTESCDGVGRRTVHEYDGAGRLWRVHGPWDDDPGSDVCATGPAPEEAPTSTTEYDELNRVVATIDALGRRAETAYTPGGRVASRTQVVPGDPQGPESGSVAAVAVGDAMLESSNDAYADARVGTNVVKVDGSGNYPGQKFETDDNRFYVFESMLAFDTRGVPESAAITDVGLEVDVVEDGSGVDFALEVYAYDFGATVETGDWVDPSEIAGLTLVATLDTATISGPGTYRFVENGDAFVDAVDPDGDTRLVVIASRHRDGTQPSGDEWVDFTDSETDPPVLQVGYDLAPGTPSGHDLVTTHGYDAAGRLAWTDLPGAAGQRRTTFGYDADGNTTTVTNAEDETTTTTYDPMGRPLVVTDPAGVTTSSTWSPRGELLSRQVSGQGAEEYGYDAAGVLEWVEDPLDNRTTYAYDTAGRRVRRTNAAGGVFEWSYSDDGLLLSETDELDRTTAYSYDAVGRLATLTDPSGRVRTTTYNAAGQPVTVGFAGGDTDTYTYDRAGRRASVTNSGGTWSWAYLADGSLAAETSPDGAVTRWEYDGAGRRSLVQYPDGSTTRYAYDPATGRLAAIAPGESMADTFTAADGLAPDPNKWTPRNQLGGTTTIADNELLLTYPDVAGARGGGISKGPSAANVEVSFRYQFADTDPSGLLRLFLRETVGSGDASYRIEIRNNSTTGHIARIQGTTTTQLGTFSTAETTGPQRLRVQLIDGDLQIKTWLDGNPEPAEWAAAITDSVLTGAGRTRLAWLRGTGTSSVSIDEWRQTVPGTNPAAFVDYTYDDADRPTGEQLLDGSRTWNWADGRLASYDQTLPGAYRTSTLGYDTSGRISSLTTGANSSTYGYDNAGQLTSITPTSGNPTSIAYDELGRRTTRQSGPNFSVVYTYDAASQLLSTTPTSGQPTTYSYDAAGRRLTATTGADVTTNTYDPAGRLATIDLPDGSTQQRTYDPLQRLAGLTNTVADITTEHHINWDGHQLLDLRSDASATNLIGNGWRSAAAAGGPAWTNTAIATDILGSALPTTALPDLARATNYDPWGRPNGSDTLEPHIGYRGELHLGNLLYLRARNYDPQLGQFTTTDPLDGVNGTPVIANPYHYANNDPLNRVDPLGLRPDEEGFFPDDEYDIEALETASLAVAGLPFDGPGWTAGRRANVFYWIHRLVQAAISGASGGRVVTEYTGCMNRIDVCELAGNPPELELHHVILGEVKHEVIGGDRARRQANGYIAGLRPTPASLFIPGDNWPANGSFTIGFLIQVSWRADYPGAYLYRIRLNGALPIARWREIKGRNNDDIRSLERELQRVPYLGEGVVAALRGLISETLSPSCEPGDLVCTR